MLNRGLLFLVDAYPKCFPEFYNFFLISHCWPFCCLSFSYRQGHLQGLFAFFLSGQWSRNCHQRAFMPFVPLVLSLGGWGREGMAWGHQEPSDQPCVRELDSAAAPQAACGQFCPRESDSRT